MKPLGFQYIFKTLNSTSRISVKTFNTWKNFLGIHIYTEGIHIYTEVYLYKKYSYVTFGSPLVSFECFFSFIVQDSYHFLYTFSFIIVPVYKFLYSDYINVYRKEDEIIPQKDLNKTYKM